MVRYLYPELPLYLADHIYGDLVQYFKDLGTTAKPHFVLGYTIAVKHGSVILFRHLPAPQRRA